MLAVMVVTLKIQKLPCILSGIMGKDAYVMIMLYFVIELFLVMLAFFIANRTRNHTYEFKDNLALRLFKRVLLIAAGLYFLMQGVLFYEAIQDLFAHILFENLPWTLFSLLLVALVFYLANSGLRNIALNYELYAFIVFGSLIMILIFGAVRTDVTSVLPLQTINFSAVKNSFVKINFWFGDFFFVLVLARESKEIKFKWTVLTYVIAMVFVISMVIVFTGIYLSYSPMQPSLVSVLSEQSMLGVDIGRIDWFLILLSEIGTILSSGVCLYFAKKCIHGAMPKIKQGYILAVLMLALYLLDVLLLVDLRMKLIVYMGILSYFGLAIKIIVLIVGVILAICAKNERKDETQNKDDNEVIHKVKKQVLNETANGPLKQLKQAQRASKRKVKA